jgi:hypothetical protein
VKSAKRKDQTCRKSVYSLNGWLWKAQAVM